MKTKTVIFVAALAFALTRQGPAQTYDTNNVAVQTFAGSGLWGYVNGVGQETMFNNPNVIVANSAGDLIVLDAGNFCLRKISTNGSVTSFAVLPDYGVDGVGSMTIDKAGIIWIAGSGGRLVRVTGGAQVSTVNLGGSLGWSPGGICADSANNIFVSDPSYHKIYRYRTNGVFELFAGSGNPGSQDGNGIFTSFTHPRVFAADAADNLYVWDAGNYLVRRINQNADVTTIAGIGSYSRNGDVDGVGQSAAINYVATMCADNWGNILMCCGTSIRKMSAQLVQERL